MAAIPETTSKETGLPRPEENPRADVVIFDGHCRFCRGQVERLRRLDGQNRLAYLSLHDPQVAQKYPDLTHAQLMEQMYVVDQQGRRHGGVDAVRYLARRLPKLWWALPALYVPFSDPLWRWCYRQVAKRRYLIAGKADCDDEACQLHMR